MEINASPKLDQSANTTGCCPRFNSEGWDGVDLHFRDKLFLRAETLSVLHVPLNMGKVFSRVQDHIDKAGAIDPNQYIVLSCDVSAFKGEHLFAVTADVPGEEMIRLSGDYVHQGLRGSVQPGEGLVRSTEGHRCSTWQDRRRNLVLLHDLPQMREGLREELRCRTG
jgi:hypothetical protein